MEKRKFPDSQSRERVLSSGKDLLGTNAQQRKRLQVSLTKMKFICSTGNYIRKYRIRY
jgi:hypothetical protein